MYHDSKGMKEPSIEKNQSMFDTLRHDLLTFFLRKNAITEQTIVKGCASLIASHIFDCDHPYVSKNLQPYQTFQCKYTTICLLA